MKAVVLHQYGGPQELKFEDAPDPTPGPGEVLIRIAAASINPIDFKMRSGEAKARFPIEFPYILGRDLSGVIREVGPNVVGFAPGDQVLALTMHTYAELAVVKVTDLAKAPEGLDLIEAAALPLVMLTGDQLIRLGAKVQSEQTILVTGALGGVGRTAVMVAKKLGTTVIAGVRKSQLAHAKDLGADQVIALDDHDALAKLGFLDAVADTVGHKTAEVLLAKVRPGGIFASVLGSPANAALHPTVTIAPIMTTPDAAALAELAGDVTNKKLTIPIDRMIPLAQAAEGQAAAEKGGIGKVLLLA